MPRANASSPSSFRPPAVPLAVVDPYFSVWSFDDRLTGSRTRHWTGASQPLNGLVRIDGKAFRFLGVSPKETPAMPQTACEVHPTRTVCRFQARGVELTVTFLTPLLPHDLAVFSWPVTYVDFTLRSLDGRPHRAELYFDADAQLAVDNASQSVNWGRLRLDGLDVQFCGSADQRVLGRSGDDLRIDWGHLYLAAPADAAPRTAVRGRDLGAEGFATGKIDGDDDLVGFPHAVHGLWPKLTCRFEGLSVPAAPGEAVSRYVLLAYDDGFSLEYHHRKLRPYWRRAGLDIGGLLRAAVAEHESIFRRCAEFDAEVEADLAEAGGPAYAELCALAYRQTCAAHKLAVDFDGTPVYFSKENFSNGCIATVDVTYPSAPFFLLFNPTLLRAQIEPVCAYARSPRWKFPFAPHDLGTYPLANGQVYGGGEETVKDQMPVEECGNMLLLAGALTRWQGDDFARANQDVLGRWAEYLRAAGFNPAKQLCTDDFAGHFAHNTNLSLKAILALGAWGRICERLDRREEAAAYAQTAREMAARWMKEADDGDHYRLAFDQPGTWSLKYNLVWDRLLELDLFPPEVARRELAFYRAKQDREGLPLDGRKRYGKLDWAAWVAALADTREEFAERVRPLRDWAHRSPSRVPLTDWSWTHTGRQVHWGQGARGPLGFQARSVVGGVFIRLLFDAGVREKWLARAQAAGQPSPTAGMVPVEEHVGPVAAVAEEAG